MFDLKKYPVCFVKDARMKADATILPCVWSRLKAGRPSSLAETYTLITWVLRMPDLAVWDLGTYEKLLFPLGLRDEHHVEFSEFEGVDTSKESQSLDLSPSSRPSITEQCFRGANVCLIRDSNPVVSCEAVQVSGTICSRSLMDSE